MSITASKRASMIRNCSSFGVWVVTPLMVYFVDWNSSKLEIARKFAAISFAFSAVAAGMLTDCTYPFRSDLASMYFMM